MNTLVRQGLLVTALLPATVFAGIDKIYEPYVTPGEKEIEIRGIHQLDDTDTHKLKVGIGYGVNATWFVEGYLIADKTDGQNSEISAAELENRFQLTAKGQYWLDLGLLAELEKTRGQDLWELKAGPIVQKQIDNWVTTANLLFESQFGNDKTEDSTRGLGSIQVKYRLSRELEPGIEYHQDDNTSAIGPVLLGSMRWGSKPVNWDVGVFAGLNNTTADTTVRWDLEWEF